MATSVTAFMCEGCKGLHKTEADADKCCTCKCGVKLVRDRGSYHSPSEFPTRSAKTRLRYARERVRKLTSDLRQTHEELGEWLDAMTEAFDTMSSIDD